MKNNRGFMGIGIIVAIIAILVVGGGVYVYESKKTETPVVNTGTQPVNQNQQQTNTQTPPLTTKQVASITVLSPSAGERVSAGSSFLIKWNSVNISNRVLLTLHLSSIQQVIAPDSGADITVLNNGSFTWKVPKSFDELNSTPVDRDYVAYITIQDAQNKNIIAQSKNFTITPQTNPSSSTKICSNAGMSATVLNQPNYQCDTQVARVFGNGAVALSVNYKTNLSSVNSKEVLSIYKFANQVVFNESKDNIDYNLVNSNYPISGTTGLYYEGKQSIGSDNKRIVVSSRWIIITIAPASYPGISQTSLDSITNSISF